MIIYNRKRDVQMERFQEIEAKIEKGYASIRKNNYTEGCDIWLAAWEEVKALM